MSAAQHSFACSQSQRTSKPDLVSILATAYEDTGAETVDTVFLSLQQALDSTMRAKGGNDYKLQHMGEATLRREGKCPTSIQCGRAAVGAVAEMK